MNMNIAREAFEDELSKLAIIKREGKKFVLMSHKGKVLGKHSTRAGAMKQEKAISISKRNSMAKHAFMRVEDLEDDSLGAHLNSPELTELAETLLQKEKDKSFALRHPLVTGLPTLGMWPLIKEQYALRRVGRHLLRNNPEFSEQVHRRGVESDNANQASNAASELAHAYLLSRSMS
jgi:hypothetical protein